MLEVGAYSMGIYDVKLVVKCDGKHDKKVASWRMDGNERFFVRFRLKSGQSSKEYEMTKDDCGCVGGKRIDPWLSYLTNPWNVMLPYVTYTCNTDFTRDYLLAIGVSYLDEEIV